MSTAVERIAPPDLVLTPHDESWLARQADALAKSSLVPKELRGKPADVLQVIGWGHAVGLPPALAINNMHIVEGQPYVKSHALAGLAEQAGHHLQVLEMTAKKCVVLAWRRDETKADALRVEYEYSEAVTAKLVKDGSAWQKHPVEMCLKAAKRRAVRVKCSEIITGLASLGVRIDNTDAGDFIDAPPEPVAELARPDVVEATARPAPAPDPQTFPARWRAACTAAGIDRDTSSALIAFATDGTARQSADVDNLADEAECINTLARFTNCALVLADGKIVEAS